MEIRKFPFLGGGNGKQVHGWNLALKFFPYISLVPKPMIRDVIELYDLDFSGVGLKLSSSTKSTQYLGDS